MATAELAVALPALALVVWAGIGVVGAAGDLARASDAARSAARSASIGEEQARVVAAGERVAPQGSVIEVAVSAGWARARVTVPPLAWGPIRLSLPAVTASIPVEPGVADEP